MKDLNKNLLIAIGNEGRSDDGIAWEFLKEVKKKGCADWELVKRHQLSREDANLISQSELVVFADAYNGKLQKGYLMEECYPRVDDEYSSQALNPCAVLALCKDIYDKRPASFVLKIQGNNWGVGKGLSDLGTHNVEKAVAYFERKFLMHKTI